MQIERELMRGAGPVAILKLLQDRPKYGYELVESLARESGGLLTMGQSTLYPLLYNLESQGVIRGRKETSENGRTRKYYSLTAKGKRRLEKDIQQWKVATTAMQNLGILPAGLAIVDIEGRTA